MTFASRYASDGPGGMAFAVLIQGVPLVLVRGALDVDDTVLALADWGSYANVTRLPNVRNLEIGKKRLDLVQRRMIGGSLVVGITDDDSQTLRSLFVPRARRVGYLTADLDSSVDFDAYLSTTTGLRDPGPSPTGNEYAYIGAETIPYDNLNATDIGITGGGLFGSTTSVHLGGAEQGASVFASPPSWIGRRVKVLAFFVEEDGSSSSTDAMVIDTFRLEEAPAYMGPEEWELRASHLSDEVAARKLGTGLQKVNGFPGFLSPVVTGADAIYTVEGTNRFTVGNYPTYFLTRAGSNAPRCLQLSSSNGPGLFTEVTVTGQGLVSYPGGVVVNVGQPIFETAEHIALLRNGSPGVLALLALVSKLGDGTDGLYDALPGVDPAVTGEDGWRFGAGVPADEIDVDAFLEAGRTFPGWEYVIDKEVGVVDFLRDFCIVTQTVWLIDRDGRLTVKPLQERLGSVADTITNEVGVSKVSHDESSIFPRVSLRCGYDPIVGDFTQTVQIVDQTMTKRYPTRGEAHELESRALHVAPEDTATEPHLAHSPLAPAVVEGLLRRYMVGDGRGRLVVSLTTHLDHIALDLGDVVTVDVDLPDLEGGSVQGRRAVVVGIEPKVKEGGLALDLHVVETPYVVAPAAIITAVTGGDILTLGTGPETDGTGDPARMFGSLWRCRIYDVSAGTSELVYASPMSDTELLLGAVPAMTIEVGVDFITVADNDERDYAAANVPGSTPDDCAYQQADDEAIAGDELLTRWR
jgi:hypothetical protein